MGETLALFSALCFGLADFAAGLLSRHAKPELVALIGQVGGLIATAAAAFFVSAPSVGAADLSWGGLSGLGTGIGVLFLYRGMSRGRLSVVVPLSVVGGVAVPVLAGVALLNDRPDPLAWCGIAVAFPALWLIARGGNDGDGNAAHGAVDGLIAGAGFALQNIGLGQVDPAAGLWPIVAGRAISALTLLPMTRPGPPGPGLRPKLVLPTVFTGVLGAAAIVLYTLATQQQLLAIAVVLSSLYPAIPVLFGIAVLKERLNWPQVLGLLGAATAVLLLAG
ncbi:DMT family transporter [Amycolatopsis decaplanina]|uniref:DMT family permease n=1 Tax=Amycolatopsis decaplanina DSM 44594 TaxID=1284240 RepID=M2ZXZ4_9PSEU|nr:DMT family transporter [Amycolatopsis decaplanina]EME65209.1 DMT family permease [Amycolatopsis decaplanina DSM 44594]